MADPARRMHSLVEALRDVDRREVVRDLNDLLQLDHDALQAYEEALLHVESQEWGEVLAGFRRDHERHARDLTAFVRRLGGTPKERPHATGALKKGFVAAGSTRGDGPLLKALRMNEVQARLKYERYAAKLEYPGEVSELIRLNAQDERRHLDWLTDVVGAG